MRKSTLRSRLVLGFGLVTAPLIVLLIVNNWYAMNVVQKQVAASNQNLVTMNMGQIDQKLSEADHYLLKTTLQDPGLLSLGSYPENSEEAVYAKVNAFNRLSQDIPYYADMDAFFAYRASSRELIFAAQQSMAYEEKEAIRAKLAELLASPESRQPYMGSWRVVKRGGEYALLRVMEADKGSYAGAWVSLDRFLKPFHALDMGDEGRVLIAASDGTLLASDQNPVSGAAATAQASPALKEALTDDSRPYRLVSVGDTQSKRMMVSRRSQMADIQLAVLLPVRSLLERLPLFQWFIYLTPPLAVGLLLLFLVYLQRSILVPVRLLLKGMRQMRAGNFNMRLAPSPLAEFDDINGTFNRMSDEIETLKIDIYEEQIKTQRAELRHLQAQIHPHFFTNCLNLIYNLAQVKNIPLVQKLTLQLVRHLRFTIRTNVASVPLAEELAHIRNYLSIQELRFPGMFEYAIETTPPEAERASIPPLTIQPFVENAIEHGFCYNGGEPFRVVIGLRIETSPDSGRRCLAVTVSDNGVGFAPEILTKLQSGDYFTHEYDGHIGIWNVYHRCQLYYRTGVLLQFGNGSQGGAEIGLKLPLDGDADREDSHV